ncbi:hypothetical protein PLANPX_5177 [Lacipirellula parvula]|uniref:Uncharacterized protein n=1 Tax=Lacipirellula parvula TaxID=2650471 RepID=A0A5K7XGP4_9BACT|nr:hypothetical protein PLANPX_5177 [Lacipirellula parvula]
MLKVLTPPYERNLLMRQVYSRAILLGSSLSVAALVYACSPTAWSSVFGAVTQQGCKGECSVDSMTVDECLHSPAQNCDPATDPHACCDVSRCTRNEVRFAKCQVGNNPEDPCKIHTDMDDWWRKLTIRREECADQGYSSFEYVPNQTWCVWDGPSNARGETPCKTSACSTGPIVSISTYAGRMVCGD